MPALGLKRSRLGDYLRIKHGYAFKGSFFANEGPFVVLTPGNFARDGGLRLKGEGEKYYTGEFPEEFLLARGDFLIVMTDLTQNAPILGSPAVIPESGRFLHNQRLGKIVDLNEEALDRRFLYHLLNSSDVRAQIKASATGATVKHTAPERIYAVKVPIPSLATQRKIAAILSAYDDLIDINTRRIAILEEMARLLYREWFVDFRFPGHESVAMVDSPLGPIPDGWEVDKFTNIADVLSGGTPKTTLPEYWGGTIPFFTPKDVGVWPYVSGTEKAVTQLGLDSCSSQLYPAETVFITARGTVGKVVMPAVSMAMNQSCYALQGRDGMSQYYLYLMTLDCVERLRQQTGGATFDTIIVDTFRRLDVIKPPLRLVDEFAEIAAPFFRLAAILIAQEENLRHTRDLLLPRLVSGELDVSDPDIEAGELIA